MADQTSVVVCADCGTPVRTPKSRAERLGAGCRRKRAARRRAAARPVTLPGLSGHGGRAAGPGQDPIDGVDDVVHAGGTVR